MLIFKIIFFCLGNSIFKFVSVLPVIATATIMNRLFKHDFARLFLFKQTFFIQILSERRHSSLGFIIIE
ncbi:MAG TPA: hypothetical protein DCL74_03895 [Succinivibrionaceae bacterium]|nr:hypothetical protein [Succinivibrionaceae bacterium]